MMVRFIGITVLAILLIGGLIAAFYSQDIEQALTLPSTRQLSAQIPHTGSAKSAKATPTVPAPTATATSVATQGQQLTPLAQDTFRRADQSLWGVASDGQSWGGDANTLPAFSIAGSMGQVVGSYGQGAQVYSALLGPVGQNVDIVATMSVNLFEANVNLSVVLRWHDANNWYKAQIDGSELTVFKRVNGVITQLGTIRFPALSGKAYTIHFRAIGATLFASVWQSDQPEPNQWMLVVSDMSLLSGKGGMRFVVENTTVIRLSSFLETVASSGI